MGSPLRYRKGKNGDSPPCIFSLQGNLKQHQAIHNNTPKKEALKAEEMTVPVDSTEKDARQDGLTSGLNLVAGRENGVKRAPSTAGDTGDSLLPAKRPAGKYINPSKPP